MIEFDATLVAALAFVAFIGLLFFLKVPGSIGSGLDNQAKAIADELEKAKQLRVQAEELRKSYEVQTQAAKVEAEAMIAQAKDDAKRLKAQAKVQLKADIEAQTKAAGERISRAEQVAIMEVRQFAANAAVEMAERMIVSSTAGKGGEKLLADSMKAIEGKLTSVS